MMTLEIPGIGSPATPPEFPPNDQNRGAPRVPRPVIDGKPVAPPATGDPAVRDARYEKLLEQLFTTLAPYDKEVKFSINRELGEVVVKVVDAKTDKVIKEIPPEEIQKLQAKIKEAVGLLIDKMI